MPSNPYVTMKFVREVIKSWRLLAELTMSLNAVLVLGTLVSSLKLQPPIEIQVFKDGFFFFSAVKCEYRVAELASIGDILKVFGSKKAKAKFTCDKPVTSRSSGCRVSHLRVDALE